MSETQAVAAPIAPIPTRLQLFTGFLSIGLQGFGGVLPWARRMLVDQRRWLGEREFIEILSLSQFLPGPNIVNLAVIVGSRYRGPLGAVVALSGLMLMPFLIVIALAALYSHFETFAAVRGATTGVSAAATGLIIATALRMGGPLRERRWQIAIAVVTFAAMALARMSLVWVLAVLAPVSIALAWRKRR